MKKIIKILLIPLIVIIALLSLISVASATYIPVVTPACATYIPFVYQPMHEAFTGEKALLVVSPSMAPTIQEGAIVYYTPVQYSQLNAGDIIVCKHPQGTQSMPILRRIVAINATSYTAKGDGNSVMDPWTFTPDLVVGKVTQIINPSGAINFHPSSQGTVVNNDNQPPTNVNANYSGAGDFEFSALVNGNQYTGSFSANISVAVQQDASTTQFSFTLTPTSASENIAPLLSTDGTKITFNFAGTTSGSEVTANAKGNINGASFDVNLNGTIDSNTLAFTVNSGSSADVKLSSVHQIVLQK